MRRRSRPAAGPAATQLAGSPAHNRPARPGSESMMNANPWADAGTATTLAAGSHDWRVKELPAVRSDPAMARATSTEPGVCCE
jgi:hypothetical protein